MTTTNTDRDAVQTLCEALRGTMVYSDACIQYESGRRTVLGREPRELRGSAETGYVVTGAGRGDATYGGIMYPVVRRVGGNDGGLECDTSARRGVSWRQVSP